MLKSLKSLLITLCTALPLYAAPAFAAGTLPLAMAQQVDINGHPVAGCLVNFFVAGTVATPQNNYADFSLTQPQANPLQCDQSGRVPMFWLADGLIHVRLTDSSGSPIIDTTMQVLGPSSGGGGGGGTVDPTSVMATGDMKARYGTGPLSGFVRANALTIGSATSGATERANADTQALFVYLYNTDANLAVSGGRTGNALNDFNANKQLTLPDWRGRTLAGLADMGNSVTTALTAAGFGNSVTTLGAAGGSQTFALLSQHMAPHAHGVSGTTGNDSPDHTHSGTTGNENADHTHNVSGTTAAETQNHTHAMAGGATFVAGTSIFSFAPGGSNNTPTIAQTIGPNTGIQSANHNHAFAATSSGISANHQHSFTSAGANSRHQHPFAATTDAGPGASQPFPTVTPTMLSTIYMKL